jgi:hypothetical protein
MVFEARFNSTVLADILSIPTSKTLLRRHLNTLFIDLIGPQMYQMKRDAESQPGHQQLSATTKVKHVKRSVLTGGIFSHKRTKSQDSHDLFCTPILFGSGGNSPQETKSGISFHKNFSLFKNSPEITNSKPTKVSDFSSGASSTLPVNTNVTEASLSYYLSVSSI